MSRSELTVVILAAGKGARLEPLSLHHSKAMTPILGVPILARIIELFRKVGLSDFVVVKAPDDADLDKLCDDLHNPAHGGISIRTAIQEKQLGTAAALHEACELIKGDFILSSCDNLFPEKHLDSLIREHLTFKPPAVITLEPFAPAMLKRSAGVRLDGNNVLEIREKPGDAVPGDKPERWDAMAKFLFVFQHRLLDYLERIKPSVRGELEVQDALCLLMKDSDVRPRGVFAGEFLHLTSEMDLINIHKHYLEKLKPFSIHARASIHSRAVILDPVMIEERAEICAGAVVGPYVYMGKSAYVGADARVNNAVIYPQGRVNQGEVLEGAIRLLQIRQIRGHNT